MDDPFAEALDLLKSTDSAVPGGDFVILYRHGRWHLITLTYFGGQRGLHTLNFMSDERAHDMLTGWLSGAGPQPYDAISPAFAREAAAKILPRAKDYLPLLERGWLDIGGGFTTDTTWHAGYDPARAEAFIASIDKMMESGAAGLYLRFHRLDVSEARS